jgi:restriction system protein
LDRAKLVSRPAPGYVALTERGRSGLADPPARVDIRYLRRFEEYEEWRERCRAKAKRRKRAKANGTDAAGLEENGAGATETRAPEETIEDAVRESNAAVTSSLLERVLAQRPEFLEKLVLALLLAMGYGSRASSAQHPGRSNDTGIDGTISRDEPGWDKVYVQAKRYAPDRSVGSPELHEFAGAMQDEAGRGVFITTSRFSREAGKFAERGDKPVVLIDGQRLAELMMHYNVGVQAKFTAVLKRIDENFFDQDEPPSEMAWGSRTPSSGDPGTGPCL